MKLVELMRIVTDATECSDAPQAEMAADGMVCELLQHFQVSTEWRKGLLQQHVEVSDGTKLVCIL
jgi:hypothetical protein